MASRPTRTPWASPSPIGWAAWRCPPPHGKRPESSELAMQLGEAVRFLPQRLPRRRIQAPERLRLHLALVVTPGAGDAPVDQEGLDRVRSPRIEDLGPVLLRQDLRPPRVGEQRRVPGGQ